MARRRCVAVLVDDSPGSTRACGWGADVVLDTETDVVLVTAVNDTATESAVREKFSTRDDCSLSLQHPTHTPDAQTDLHVEPEPGSSLGATLRARGREVRRDELVSNRFHVCVGQKIGVPPKLRDVPFEET